MRRILTIGTLVLSMGVGGAVFAQAPANEGETQGQTQQMNETSKTKMPSQDKRFIDKAAQNDMEAIDLGKLATDRASNDQVKDFAKKTVDEHTQSLDKLKKIASDENAQIPNNMTSEARHKYDKLSKLNGPKFDQEYVKISEQSHKRAVDAFQRASNEVKTPDLKDYAQSTLPKLKQNGQELSQLKSTTKSETKGSMKNEQMKGTMPEGQNPSEQ